MFGSITMIETKKSMTVNIILIMITITIVTILQKCISRSSDSYLKAVTNAGAVLSLSEASPISPEYP